MQNKNLLLIFRNPPFANSSNRETLDIALSSSAFEIPVSLLFLNDGLLQIVKNQQSQLLEQKCVLNTFSALEMFDINSHYLLQSDLNRYQLSIDDLMLPCNILEPDQLPSLIRQFDTVINL